MAWRALDLQHAAQIGNRAAETAEAASVGCAQPTDRLSRSCAAQLAEASSAETNWAALRLLINYFRSKCVDAALTWMPCRRFCNICSSV